MGFWHGKGSNFPFPNWLASSPLQHSRTTMRVCDVKHGSFSDAFQIYRHMTDAMSSLFEVRRLPSHGGVRVIGIVWTMCHMIMWAQPITDWVNKQFTFYRFTSLQFAKYLAKISAVSRKLVWNYTHSPVVGYSVAEWLGRWTCNQ